MGADRIIAESETRLSPGMLSIKATVLLSTLSRQIRPYPRERQRTIIGRLLARMATIGRALILPLGLAFPAFAQTAPSAAEIAAYQDLHAAAAQGDTREIERLLRS